MARNKRTLQMMENYISLHEQGLSLKEIAVKYKLSTSLVYASLQEIADKAGVTRNSLLGQPSTQPMPVETDNSFDRHFQAAIDAMNGTRKLIGEAIREAESFNAEIKRREKAWY